MPPGARSPANTLRWSPLPPWDASGLKIRHYSRQTGEETERVISPQQLVYYRDNWYVDSWCHLRDGIRSFSIDAIRHAEMLKEKAKEVPKS
jgi:predicted DNA-binding transcriptional regulator YafY